ncbi:MAG: Gfo/Idh/MocA family oxidoreductase, partial [Bifidobacteriaceae bacterium]|nr:Gfo/Idh/MocA family oxidoreductase [Bifidobacteriaceae bacterium]
MANLRAGVIGIGSMGRHHARIMREIDGVDLVAVADPGGDRFSVARDLPVGQSVEDLIAAKIDLAVVAVPTAGHEEVGLRLAEARVPTMFEKPVAASAAAALRLRDAFDAAGTVACVGHVERFNPAIAGLRQRIGQGELGEVYQVATRRQGPFPSRISDVGVVKDLATHDINSTQWLAGADYAVVSAQVSHRALREHEDMVLITGRMSNGVLVNHIVNWLSPMKERLTIVTGERGALVADTAAVTLTF